MEERPNDEEQPMRMQVNSLEECEGWLRSIVEGANWRHFENAVISLDCLLESIVFLS